MYINMTIRYFAGPTGHFWYKSLDGLVCKYVTRGTTRFILSKVAFLRIFGSYCKLFMTSDEILWKSTLRQLPNVIDSK